MDIGIIVFAYNRSWHLEKVLDGLKKNKEVSKLYIFQDGLKCEGHRDEWEMTQQVIKCIDWCEVKYTLSSYNKGLAKSIVDGINTVFEDNDVIVVLEDDCVPAANFISFMQQCFEKYWDDKRIFAVTGYSDPVELPYSEYDIYGCGICPSWGWGTWKDRWLHYRIDGEILNRIKCDRDKSKYLATWGENLKPMLVDRILGLNDSWAVYWGLNIIENNGICINPYESLIQNIGMDGTGVHCGVTDKFNVRLSDGLKHDFHMPDKVDVLHTTEAAFAADYGNYTALNVDNITKEIVLVYGIGKFYQIYEKEINDLYYVAAFIDRRKSGWYAGKKIIYLDGISEYNFSKIIIMIQDISECISCIKELMKQGIKAENIVLGHSLVGRYSEAIDKIIILDDGTLQLEINRLYIRIESGEEFSKVSEIFIEKACSYLVNNENRDIVFTIGKDAVYTALYFAGQNNVDKVYAFEASDRTILTDTEILRQNKVSEKVTIYQINEVVFLDMIKNIISNNTEKNNILKVDVLEKGNDILKELLRSRLLEKFQFIMIKIYALYDKSFIFRYLKENNFSWYCCKETNDLFFINAYK